MTVMIIVIVMKRRKRLREKKKERKKKKEKKNNDNNNRQQQQFFFFFKATSVPVMYTHIAAIFVVSLSMHTSSVSKSVTPSPPIIVTKQHYVSRVSLI